MLRSLLLAVLAANLAFLVWSQGWLAPSWPGPSPAQGEPQRLTNQVRPDGVRVLPVDAGRSQAAAARRAAAACLEAGPFSTATLAAAQARLTATSLPPESWVQRSDRNGELWLRADRAPAAIQAQLRALPADDLADGFKPCRAP
jgi:hypothetical protein